MATGKWTQPGVPHRGWQCVEMEDLGPGESEPCQMCETAEPRYIHVMQHDDYVGTLRVGCICAATMEGDYAAPKERERTLRNRAAKLARWVNGDNWRISKRGNYWRKHQGCRVVIHGDNGDWRVFVHHANGEELAMGPFMTLRQAKTAAYEAINGGRP